MTNSNKNLNYDEIEFWIENNEALNNWARSWLKMNRVSNIRKFIKENHKDLVNYIIKKAV